MTPRSKICACAPSSAERTASIPSARVVEERDDDLEEKLGLRGGVLDRFLEPRASYVLTRFVILRLLGVVYFAAFLSAALQLDALIGPGGLLPAQLVVDHLKTERGGPLAASREAPSLFLWTGASTQSLAVVSWIGVALSVALLAGATNALLLVMLWGLYLSMVNVGTLFYGYGWEIQLLETGLCAAFLCPLYSIRPFPRAPPPVLTLWLFRWLIARVMLGAGLIKLRGDDCWRDLTCLHVHYETQPIPGPLSPWLHRLPGVVHSGGVLLNHFVEVLAPLFAFGPRFARHAAGIAFVGFQVVLILSGNLSFLNWLTIVPAIACFDDEALRRVLPRALVTFAERSTTERRSTRAALWSAGGYGLVVLLLSINPVANMISPSQEMNRSFDPLHVVNTYGAFGSVNRERLEVIVMGSDAEDPYDDAAYREYVFPCKPGPVDRSLCWLSPYHRRLDWQMWFLPFGEAEQNPWFIHLVAKLLSGDPGIRREIEDDPFDGAAPRWVRAELYRYRFADGPDTWSREHVGSYLRPVDREDEALAAYLAAAGFPPIARSAE